MRESSYYPAIIRYYEKNTRVSVAFEAKFTRTNRLSFDALAPHQEQYLLKATVVHGWKLPDSGIGIKPYDGYVLYGARAVMIAIYYKPRATEVYEIPIRTFIEEKYVSKEKSLTREKAAAIGTRLSL